MDQNNLIKEFEFFCKLAMGQFKYELFPECKKLDYVIRIEYHVREENNFEYLLLRAESSKEDFEIINIKNFKLLDIKRGMETDERGELTLYTLNIVTDKGTLSIKRSSKENKILIEFESNDISYKSSIIF